MNKINEQSTLENYMHNYLEREKTFIKESSYSVYSAYVFNKIIPHLGHYLLEELNNQILQDFVTYLQTKGNLKTEGGLCIDTTKSILIFLKSSLEYLFKQNIIKSFDTNIKFIDDKKNKQIHVFNEIETIKIRDHLKQNPTYKNLSILISMYTGLRIGEVCALKWEHIDLNTNMINIEHTIQRINIKTTKENISKLIITTPKSRKSIRTVPINNEIIELLKIYQGDQQAFITSNTTIPVEPRTIRYNYAAMLKKLNIKHRTFHALRHTFATRLIKHTNDFKTVSELLGHSSISITLDTYTHTTIETKIDCINKF